MRFARTRYERSLFSINYESWGRLVAQYRRDCERVARSAEQDKLLKAGSARAMAESRHLLAVVEDRLLR
jgi:hypothetical protein